jgi:hypothetical protein
MIIKAAFSAKNWTKIYFPCTKGELIIQPRKNECHKTKLNSTILTSVYLAGRSNQLVIVIYIRPFKMRLYLGLLIFLAINAFVVFGQNVDKNSTATEEQEELLLKGIDLVIQYAETRTIYDAPAKIISVPGCPTYDTFDKMKFIHVNMLTKLFILAI